MGEHEGVFDFEKTPLSAAWHWQRLLRVCATQPPIKGCRIGVLHMQGRSRHTGVFRSSILALRLAILCLLSVTVIATIGCGEGPKIDKCRWTSIEVFYCVGDGEKGVVKGKTWKTPDETIVRRINDAYHEIHRTETTVANAMETNCITINLENGESWWLYLFGSHLASFHNVPDRRLAYDVSIAPEFRTVLAEEIRKATGDTAFFEYPRNVTIESEK